MGLSQNLRLTCPGFLPAPPGSRKSPFPLPALRVFPVFDHPVGFDADFIFNELIQQIFKVHFMVPGILLGTGDMANGPLSFLSRCARVVGKTDAE